MFFDDIIFYFNLNSKILIIIHPKPSAILDGPNRALWVTERLQGYKKPP
jgi:hypothetical protein